MADQEQDKDELQDKLKKGASKLAENGAKAAGTKVPGLGFVAGQAASTGYGVGKIMAQPAGEGGINGGSFERTKEAQKQWSSHLPVVGKWISKKINRWWAKRNGGKDNGDGTYTMKNGTQYDPSKPPTGAEVETPKESKEDLSVQPDEASPAAPAQEQGEAQPGVA